MSDSTTHAADAPVDAPTLVQKIAAEVIGTFVLVLIGVGAAMASGEYVATGLSFGLAVLVMAYAFGRISGGHFNPAVSVGAAIGGRVSWVQAGIYVAAQFAGAILAAASLFAIFHGIERFDAEGAMGQNFFGDEAPGLEFAWWAALLLEFLMTLIFVWVILGATDERNAPNVALAPLTIGLALAMIHFASMFATGTSVNPARSLGPALFAGTDSLAQVWVFLLAPTLGGFVAGLTYPMLFGHGAAPVPGSGFNFSSGPKAVGFQPGNYEAQWNPGQAGGWNQPPQAPWGGAPDQQAGQAAGAPQWGTDPYAPQPAQPGAPQQGGQQWGGQGNDPSYGQPQAPQQWGAPQADPYGNQQGSAPGQPGHWGNPEGDDDGRTQVRRPD